MLGGQPIVIGPETKLPRRPFMCSRRIASDFMKGCRPAADPALKNLTAWFERMKAATSARRVTRRLVFGSFRERSFAPTKTGMFQ